MKKQFGVYRRLARGFFSCSSLWLGPDHVVYVQGAGFVLPFTERYLRFELAGIQSIALVRTSVAIWISVLSGIGAGISGGLTWLALDRGGGVLFALIPLLPVLGSCLLILGFNLVRGPSCRCLVQTAVACVALRPLGRERAALRTIETLRPLIAQQQGGSLTGEMLPGAPEVTGAAIEAVAAGAGVGAGASEAPDVREGGRTGDSSLGERPAQMEKRSWFLVPALGLQVFAGAFYLAYAYAGHWWPLVGMGVAVMLLSVLVIGALAEQMRVYTPGSLLTILWFTLAQTLMMLACGGVAYVVWEIKMSIESTMDEPLKWWSTTFPQPGDPGFFYYFSVINGLLGLLLGLAGLALVLKYRPVEAGNPVVAPPVPAAPAAPPAVPPPPPPFREELKDILEKRNDR